MSKSTYKALLFFQGHKPGQEFEAELDEVIERRAIDSGHIKTVSKKSTKKEEEKADG